MRLSFSLLVTALAAILALGCSGEVGDGGGPVTSDTSLSIVPPAATTSRGGEVDFHASISGDSSAEAAGFSWSVEEANGGAVDGSGRYIAPQASGTFHVVATSNADRSKQARATVTVQSTVVVSVNPKNASLVVGASASFTASVTGTEPGDSTAVTWSVQEVGGGTIDGSGNYVAPGATGTFHVVATSVADPSRSDTATVVVGAAPVIAVNIVPSNASTTTGGSLTFTATVTGTIAGQSTAVTWSVQEGGGGSIDSSGHYRAPGTTGTFHVVVTSVADPSKTATATVSVTATPVVAVSVSPATATVRVGGTVAFTATVTGTTAGQSTAVTWSVQESGGGTVDSSGHYTAPGAPGTFHVVATSVADSSKKATATVTVIPNIAVSISPPTASTTTGGTAAFTATVTGTTAGQSTAITWSVQESGGGTVDSSGHYTAPGAPGTFHVVATSVADTSKQAVGTVTVIPPIAVSISPPTASTTTGGTVAFTATVTGTTGGQSTAVTWSVQESGGGTVDGSGHYTAPGMPGTYHVAATSVADPSKSATATITVTQPVQISVTVAPTTATVSTGGTVTFSATVTGTTGGQSTAVTWSVQEGAAGGTIDGSGHYTAPGGAGTYHVVATSVADPSKRATATVTVTQPAPISVTVAPATAAVSTGGTFTFSATVSGTTGGQSTAVTWTVQESGGGSVDSSGHYTAPGAAGTYHVVATSVADPSKSGAATVTVSVPSSTDTTGLIPPDRVTVWAPGVPGGIPSYSHVFATIDASTYGNGTTDATAAINSALASAGAAASAANPQVVVLPAGTYLISSLIILNSSYVVLRGAGPTQTKIIGHPSSIAVGFKWNYTGLWNVTSDNPKGSTSITVSDASAIQAGDVLQIDMVDDPSFVRVLPDSVFFKRQPTTDVSGPGRGGTTAVTDPGWRSIGQQIEVASKSGNTLTLTGPLHLAFPLARSPQVFKTATARPGEPGTRYSGIEDLYVSGGTNNNIVFVNTAYCWARNIESDGRHVDANHGMTGIHIQLLHGFRCEIRDSYFHHANSINAGGGAYGIGVSTSSSNNLIENNIAVHLNKPLVMINSGGGNVVAYNYVDNAYSVGAPGWQENAIDGNHECFSHSDLFEGNWATNIGSDSTHGNSGWHVFYRNYATGRNSAPPVPDSGNIRAAGVDAWSREHTYVGNVYAGWVVNGQQPVYKCTANGPCMAAEAMYRVGANASSYGDFDDGTALAHLFVNGNFDPVNNAVVWDPSLTRRDLPPSLYLTSKPAFFGAQRWPFVDPLGTPMVGVLPAKQRFDSMP